MKNIIKTTLLLFFILSMIGCKRRQLKYEKGFYLENKTEKKIVHQMATNEKVTCGIDTFSFYSDGMSNKPVLEWAITAIFASQRSSILYIYESNLYNISDTTSGGWYLLWDDKGIYKPFLEESKVRFSQDDNYSIYALDYYLTVDDELLSLMKKDYSMLEKFKGYY